MTTYITEDAVEQSALRVFEELGYETAHGPDIAHDGPRPERSGYDSVILPGRMSTALRRANPSLPRAAIDNVVRRSTRPEFPSLLENNRLFHRLLTQGIAVEHRDSGGALRHSLAWLVDFDDPDNNDWLVVNQFTVVEDHNNRRPDIVVFLNGFPVAVIELKNPSDETATLRGAYNQLQTYMAEIPTLFNYNGVLSASDGAEACAGTISSSWSWFLPWKTVDGEELAPAGVPQLDVMLRGMFDRHRFLDILRNFIVFEDERSGPVKKLAAYHQYHAVNRAVECTVRASSLGGDRKVGVVWHTQGSGKSLSMAFYAGKVAREPAMANPTLVVLTDRNDLDDQLFGVFAGCSDLLRQTPLQADTRAGLRRLLTRESGGIVFTTVGKVFPDQRGERMPLLSERNNVVVVADEAHRSQYNFIDGFARHMRDALPNASFIGFTGTPIESADRNTPMVFGDYIDIYDVERAVEDGATVPIYYESRMARLALDEDEKPTIDPDFEELTEGEELEERERLKTKWAAVERLVGADKRVRQVAEDIVRHWDERLGALPGKAMIVCMSRRICVAMYKAITTLRPEWHDPDDGRGVIKVVMTGSASDEKDWQPHIRNKARRQDLANRFKDPDDPFGVVIVRDMWLTGFDCPSLHTMYADKPMRGHGLMQAIARVNRVFGEKPGGLVVDYIGLAPALRRALSDYTQSGGRGRPSFDQGEAVVLMQDQYEVVTAMFHGFDLDAALNAPMYDRVAHVNTAADFILAGPPHSRESPGDRKRRFLEAAAALWRAFQLAVPNDRALAIRDSVGFIQAVRGKLVKSTVREQRAAYEMEAAIDQIVARAVVPEGVVDLFDEAGIRRPDVSVLSDEFMAEVQKLPQRNLAAEALQKLLDQEIKVRARKNTVQARKFSEMLERSIRRYQNRTIEAAAVILELIDLARAMREADRRGESLGLSEDEVAFYDALAANESAVEVLGNETLKQLAMELVETVRNNATIDWTVKESVRANLRRLVRRALRRYGYPPDKQENAVQTVLEQAALLGFELAA